MTKRKRTIIAVVLIELMLAALWYYLHQMAVTSPSAQPGAAVTIGRTMGAVMGVILALSPFLYLMARANDRRDAERRNGAEN